jgi:SAM-dependent methyltransferase
MQTPPPPDPDSLNTLRYWDRAAAAYSASRLDGPLSLCAIYEPVVDELIADVSNKRVLDAGCGDGRYAKTLAVRGAHVTAIDGSYEMIALAMRDSRGTIEYRVADLTERLPLPDRCFDLVLANMVLMDIPRIDVAVSEFARVLTPHGALVFSLTHPCFFCSDWVHDNHGTKLHKLVDDYLSVKAEVLEFWGGTFHFHRPLAYYFNELTQRGFAVDAFKEPVPSGAQLQQHPEWQHHRRVPSFIVARATLSRADQVID